MNGIPNFVSDTSFSLTDDRFCGVLEMCHNFHDAYLDSARLSADQLEIGIQNIYFGPSLGYNAYGTGGATLELKIRRDSQHEMPREEMGGRDIYRVEWSSTDEVLRLELDGLYGITVPVVGHLSNFMWKYNK